MDLINHTVEWIKGEYLEAAIIGGTGLALLAASAAFWRFGSSVSVKTMVWPLLLMGLLFAVAGFYNLSTFSAQEAELRQQASADPAQFVQTEKTRVEGFKRIFAITLPVATVLVLAGTAMFMLLGSTQLKGIGLSLLLLGFAIFAVDYFAADRARVYYGHIVKASGGEPSSLGY